jgi:hypothetical protein
MFYVDMLIGVIATLGYFWVVTTSIWHQFVHSRREGRFLKGRLVCCLCAEEQAEITRDQWREEVIERVRKVL